MDKSFLAKESHLHALALEWAEVISKMDSKTAQWVAKDALKELNARSPTIMKD